MHYTITLSLRNCWTRDIFKDHELTGKSHYCKDTPVIHHFCFLNNLSSHNIILPSSPLLPLCPSPLPVSPVTYLLLCWSVNPQSLGPPPPLVCLSCSLWHQFWNLWSSPFHLCLSLYFSPCLSFLLNGVASFVFLFYRWLSECL